MLYIFCILAICIPLIYEKQRSKLWLAKVPIRIHVHGTRGKSCVTRKIAEILRAHGLRVLAKTTGDVAQYMYPDAGIHDIQRIGPARITEHIDTLRTAYTLQADALIVEGMALGKETMYMSEEMLHATHALIVNTRPDHAETMGESRQEVAQSLGYILPSQGILFTAQEQGAEILQALAQKAQIPFHAIPCPSPLQQQNALARAVCHMITGSNSDTVCFEDNAGIHEVSQATHFTQYSLPIVLYDFFSVNDVYSAQLLLNQQEIERADNFCIALLATRADRPLRTKAFMEWLLFDQTFTRIYPSGNHAVYAKAYAFFKNPKILCPLMIPLSPAPHTLLEKLSVEAKKSHFKKIVIIGLGNYHGYGETWRQFAKQHGIKEEVYVN